MVIIEISKSAHKKLWQYKISHECKTHSAAIEDLLTREQNEQPSS